MAPQSRRWHVSIRHRGVAALSQRCTCGAHGYVMLSAALVSRRRACAAIPSLAEERTRLPAWGTCIHAGQRVRLPGGASGRASVGAQLSHRALTWLHIVVTLRSSMGRLCAASRNDMAFHGCQRWHVSVTSSFATYFEPPLSS